MEYVLTVFASSSVLLTEVPFNSGEFGLFKHLCLFLMSYKACKHSMRLIFIHDFNSRAIRNSTLAINACSFVAMKRMKELGTWKG